MFSWPAPVVPPTPRDLKVRPLPAPELVILEFTITLLAASSVNVVFALQASELLTVILPVSVPLSPVYTVTLAPANAFCKVVVLIVAPLPVALKPALALSAAVEMVMSYGSINKLPAWPFGASASIRIPAKSTL